MTTLSSSVALVTGGASGIGRAVCLRLAAEGARVVVADVSIDAGQAVAAEVDGSFVACDVSDLDQMRSAVAAAEATFGGLDLVHLNAGISTGCSLHDDFDVATYRRAMGINLDGVVFGVHAALPALRRRGGGSIVATASLAGLTAAPFDPIYAANKHAVVGLVRSLGLDESLRLAGIRVNAVCPGFAETAILTPIREMLVSGGVPLMTAGHVAEVVVRAMTDEVSGECWLIQAGHEPSPYRFRGVPGARPAPAASA
jgi:NAD(P)-dependent dehydrogenase (short-subunit alcohol dehydrogenase family)